MRILSSILILTAGWLARGQQVVAPTPEPVGPPRGENTTGYNIVNSFETGYRFRSVGGNYGKYRSDVNYGNGVRLLASKLTIHSKDGAGGLFDEIVLNTQGLGNDPYQFASLRVGRNRWYRYDLLWRLNEYYNPALTIAGGEHLTDTRRRLQDHDLWLLPQSKVRFLVGYTRNSQSGPALTTLQFVDSRGDEFPLFADVRRLQNEFRLGGEVSLAGLRFHWLRGWDNFKEDTPYAVTAPLAGNNSRDLTTLTSFRRDEPYHGNSPYWRLALSRDTGRLLVNGRYTYVAGQRDFIQDETALGTDRLGGARNRQVLVVGNGRRPVSAGNVSLTLLATDKLTIANHTAFHNTRMEGDNRYVEVDNAFRSETLVNFLMLGIRTISTATDATYAATNWLGMVGGYHYSTRRIRSIEGQTIATFEDRLQAEQDNRIHSGVAGIRLRPAKPVTLALDGEIGRADRPFYTISERDYHALSGRAQYRGKSWLAAAWARSNYNFNSVSLAAHSARSRQYGADLSWTGKSWLTFDASYSKLHLDTATGIAYFASGRLVNNGKSLYLSNIHTGHFGMRLAVWKRVDLYAGYTRVQDTGDGRTAVPLLATVQTPTDAFYAAQTFPLSYQSPLVRLSVRLRGNIRWNLGYQYYGYGEEFLQLTRQNYRAHTGYSSVLWSF